MTSTFNTLIENRKSLTLHSVDEALVLLQQGAILYFDCSDGFLAVYKEQAKDYGLIIGQHQSQSFNFGPTISEKRVVPMVQSSIKQSNTHHVFSLPRSSFFLYFLNQSVNNESVNQVG